MHGRKHPLALATGEIKPASPDPAAVQPDWTPARVRYLARCQPPTEAAPDDPLGARAYAAHAAMLPDDGWVKLPEVLGHYVQLSRSTWYGLIRLGIAPAPEKFGSGSFWRRSDLRAFVARPPEEIRAAMAQLRAPRTTEASS